MGGLLKKDLVESLLANPFITIATAARALGVTVPTATRQIRDLESRRILKETTGRGWRKVYVSADILAILEKRTESEYFQGFRPFWAPIGHKSAD
jgi:DNA-binding Lrp family transcriptional regulator